MTGDGVNDALAIKEADIGIAMDSGSAATKAVARLVLLDGRFSQLPGVVAEGRQVIANIERVSMLFLTKTAYATALAVLFGVMLLPFPFLPRQLSVIDGLTIGIPAFFLALMPNRRRYVPGLPAAVAELRDPGRHHHRARARALQPHGDRRGDPAGRAAHRIDDDPHDRRPLGAHRALTAHRRLEDPDHRLDDARAGAVYAIPFISDFLQFTDPSLTTALLVIGSSVVAIAGIEVVRFVHRRAVARMTFVPAPALAAAVRQQEASARGGRTQPTAQPTARG